MQKMNQRFEIELSTFVDFLEKKYPDIDKCWDMLYVEDDFANIVFVFREEDYKVGHKKVLGTFSLNNSSAYEPQLDIGLYESYIEQVFLDAGINKIN